MQFTRIRAYRNGKIINEGFEEIYARDQYKALEWFKRDHPSLSDCILVAEDYDPEDDPDHFRVCNECGAVHYWK